MLIFDSSQFIVTSDDLTKLRMPQRTTINSSGASASNTSTPLPRPKKRWKLWLILCLVAGLSAWFVLKPHPIEVQAANVVTAYSAQQLALLSATGYVVAQRKAAVSSKATGRLEWLGVAEGSQVKSGDLLARIDARDVQAALENAVASVDVAKANIAQIEAELREATLSLQRSQDLFSKKFVAPSVVDQAQARYDKAVATLKSLQASLKAAEAARRQAAVVVDFTEIRAPFDGVVLSKSANVGDIVTPFSSAVDSKGAVVTMADLRTLEVEADVSEANISKIRVGQPCEIVLDALPDKRFRGEISRIVPTVDRAKATVMTKVRFEQLDQRILPEMSAKVIFLSRAATDAEQIPQIAVPPDSIVERSSRKVIYHIVQDLVEEVPVSVEGKLGELVAIRFQGKGLTTGEKIVAKPPERLRAGSMVSVSAKAAS